MARKRSHLCIAFIATLCAAAPAQAQAPGTAGKVFVFPANGQDADQQREDRMQCYAWATDQSAFDPGLAAMGVYLQGAEPSPDDASSDEKDRPVVRSAARGAAAGALVGAISGDVGTGEGAAYGAGIGAAGGGLRSRRQSQQAESADAAKAEAVAAQTRANLSNFGKAYKTCLEGRGYTVG